MTPFATYLLSCVWISYPSFSKEVNLLVASLEQSVDDFEFQENLSE